MIVLCSRNFAPAGRRVGALFTQGDFVLLVVVYWRHGADEAQENRHGVARQRGVGVLQQRVEIETFPLLRCNEQCCASRTAVVSGYQYAVDVGLDDAWEAPEDLGHFGRADVLRLPPVGVAEAVEEEPAAVWGSTAGVAGAVPEVTFREDVADEFLRRGVGIAPVSGKGFLVRDLNDDLAAFFVRVSDREASLWISDDVVARRIDFDGHVNVAVEVAEEGAVMSDAVG